ncbi:hypothetical protein [Herpetosiphon gulosus]|uniref:Tetratricopeptide repeat protein n=1 Tax=Herpetosiphon gulosus TaxID=1973496 RepID=A0ABP9X7F8_9CHLR
MNELINQAQAALLSGDLTRARGHLAQVIQQEPLNVLAWLMLSEVIHEPERQRECLQRVLALEPQNQTAQKRLAALDQPTAVIQVAQPATPSKPRQPQPPQLAIAPQPLASAKMQPISIISIGVALLILLIIAIVVLRGLPETTDAQSQIVEGFITFIHKRV